MDIILACCCCRVPDAAHSGCGLVALWMNLAAKVKFGRALSAEEVAWFKATRLQGKGMTALEAQTLSRVNQVMVYPVNAKLQAETLHQTCLARLRY